MAMLIMISMNMAFQILIVFGQYQKKSWKVKLRETMICLLFLRPAVDAYRVSTNHEDHELTVDSLSEMVMNKVSALVVTVNPYSICSLVFLFFSSLRGSSWAQRAFPAAFCRFMFSSTTPSKLATLPCSR